MTTCVFMQWTLTEYASEMPVLYYSRQTLKIRKYIKYGPCTQEADRFWEKEADTQNVRSNIEKLVL